MFFFHIPSESVYSWALECVCSKCGKQGKHDITIEQSYFSLGIIPFFPIKKRWYITCSSCKYKMNEKELDTYTWWLLRDIKKHVYPKWWMFIGLGLFIIWWFSHLQSLSGYKEALAHPAIGDKYTIHTDHEYTRMKLESISGEVLYFHPSNYTSLDHHIGMLEALHPKDFYDTGNTLSFDKSELEDMLKNGIIEEIVEENNP